MSKHTPGPWEWEREQYATFTDGEKYHVAGRSPRVFAGGSEIASVIRRGRDHGEANARLIAAAPDLLKLAHLFLEYAGTDSGVASEIHAAIAKAEGRKA